MTPSESPDEARTVDPEHGARSGTPGSSGAGAMQRILVIGSGGAGKTTFSTALAQATGLPLIHLDQHYWRSGWKPTRSEEWGRIVDELVQGQEWIMDGNYGGTMEPRLAAADTVVFLDTPRLTCLARVVRRRLLHRGVSRPSLARGCPDRLTFPFLHWIWTYPAKRRPGILKRLGELGPETAVHALRSSREVDDFLARARRAR